MNNEYFRIRAFQKLRDSDPFGGKFLFLFTPWMNEYLGRGRIGVPREPAQVNFYSFLPREWMNPAQAGWHAPLADTGRGPEICPEWWKSFVFLAFSMHSGRKSVPTKGPGYSFLPREWMNISARSRHISLIHACMGWIFIFLPREWMNISAGGWDVDLFMPSAQILISFYPRHESWMPPAGARALIHGWLGVKNKNFNLAACIFMIPTLWGGFTPQGSCFYFLAPPQENFSCWGGGVSWAAPPPQGKWGVQENSPSKKSFK